jgi:outer membrane protein TolC
MFYKVYFIKIAAKTIAIRPMLNRSIFSLFFCFLFSLNTYAQKYQAAGNSPVSGSTAVSSALNEGSAGSDASANVFTLTDCLKFALRNQPAINQALIDEAIARKNNAIAFSGWLPQVTGAANLQHYFELPVAYSTLNGVLTPFVSGVYDYATPSVTANETLFSPDVLLAVRAAKLNVLESHQNTAGTKIELVSDVTKTFYDLLLSLEQINVFKEDTARLKKNLSDTYNQYLSGVVDKVDYKQATITLNNSLSQLKSASEAVQAKYAALKQLMGFPSEKTFAVHFDTTQMMQEIYIDTLAPLQFEKRIEYQQLQTAKRIARETTMYYQLSFLPSLSAVYNYNEEYQSDRFTDLFTHAYPYSFIGLQLNIPLFTGFKRIENIRKAQLQEQRIDWDEVNLKLAIYTQYKQAISSYKSNLFYLHAQGENVSMAHEVYDIVKLQYREGIKPYLDVIVAESDLRTSEISYLNALFQLLESKIDLEKAMGDIPTDI